MSMNCNILIFNLFWETTGNFESISISIFRNSLVHVCYNVMVHSFVWLSLPNYLVV